MRVPCRSSRGSVDWNFNGSCKYSNDNCRSSRGSVDWNLTTPIAMPTMPVAPLVGAWIEITTLQTSCIKALSLLSWERGLKYIDIFQHYQDEVAPLVGAWIEILELFATACGFLVAPLVGAWIEIQLIHFWVTERIVAPLVGAWIEINKAGRYVSFAMSLLSWERGLKYISVLDKWYWNQRRSSRGSVDWNIFQCWTNDIEISRSSRGSVDWNTTANEKSKLLASLLSWERGLKYWY